MVKRKDALRALLSGSPESSKSTATTTTGDDGSLGAPDRPAQAAATSATSGASAPSPSPSPLSSASSEAAPVHRDHARSGAINAMRASWGELQKEAEAARQLREAARAGGHVVLVDPDRILPSPVVDRLSRDGMLDPGFEALKASLAADGQSVPVLLRPHSDPAKAAEGYFETAYGHRRVRAAKDLGIAVKAIVRPLSDDELVLAQGRENAERRDLTFIERAYFAKGLEARGFSRETMRAALGVLNSELTRLLQVAHRIPRPIAFAIGPAPKAGRPRWSELGEAMAGQANRERAMAFVHRPEFSRLTDTDARFRALHRHLQRGAGKDDAAEAEPVTAGDGTVLALVRHGSRSGPTLSFRTEDGGAFSAFVAAQLPELYESFRAAAGDGAEPVEAEKTDASGEAGAAGRTRRRSGA
ncbi:plasmid partitioning protein RepB [Jiella sonneratiae]|uniref:Plasmid partitioning protein RepB n=1 Tax=Jiella sonneratiae TaxID=2816856 RepID=A0ABS3JC79_9HYPH|nr:plasmid partitioning protein RepB [Jiella sonneratiae]MBO0906176.1 plasmid partitioning protein RepB [Jiella sonneratiae]